MIWLHEAGQGVEFTIGSAAVAPCALITCANTPSVKPRAGLDLREESRITYIQ